jgi:TRAP-type mannitol/chloroaromatic compound transport system permease small subunit
MTALLRLAHMIDALTEWVGKGADWAVLATVVVGFVNVAGRYVGRYLGIPIASNLFFEAQWYLFSITFFLGFAYILKHGVNVRVDFLYAKWPDTRKALVDLIGTLVVLIPFCVIGIMVTIGPVRTAWGMLPSGVWDLGAMEMSPDPNGLPRAPIKTMILVAFATLLLQAVAQCIKYVAILFGQRQVAAEIASDVEVGAQ